MKIETRSIEWVPREERHGKAFDLFTNWFACEMHITTLVTGALCVVFGLNLFWSFIAIILGTMIGALFMASHSAQGPKLGIPQMIQSRAQFGVIGAILPIFFVMFVYLGFFACSGLLGAQTLSAAVHVNLTWAILIMNVVTIILTLYGHDVIHRMQKVLTWSFIVIYAIATIIVLRLNIPAGSWSPSGFNLATFMLSVAVAATWQLTFAPYVADYSRYLPEDTPIKKAFWWTYLGTVGGTIWMMCLGSVLATKAGFLDNAGANLAKLFGPAAIILFITLVLGQLSVNVFNLYGAFMSTVTTIEPFNKLKVTPKIRLTLVISIGLIGTAIELLGQGNFIGMFKNFILFISYFLIPWTAINLLDFYAIRHGDYSIPDIFDINGKYGRVNWIACFAFIASILVEIPFVNTSLYVGPICKALGGADYSWILGLLVPVLLYYLPLKNKAKQQTINIGNTSGKITK